MSIFSIVDTVTAEIAAMKLQRQNEQAMIADVEALLGKLAKPVPEVEKFTISYGSTPIGHFEVEAPAPKPRRGRKPKAEADAPKLNAVGKPYSPQYDPNYRMNYRAGSTAHLRKPYSDKFRAHLTAWNA